MQTVLHTALTLTCITWYGGTPANTRNSPKCCFNVGPPSNIETALGKCLVLAETGMITVPYITRCPIQLPPRQLQPPVHRRNTCVLQKIYSVFQTSSDLPDQSRKLNNAFKFKNITHDMLSVRTSAPIFFIILWGDNWVCPTENYFFQSCANLAHIMGR